MPTTSGAITLRLTLSNTRTTPKASSARMMAALNPEISSLAVLCRLRTGLRLVVVFCIRIAWL